jgi:hypothetical protein
MVRKYPIRRQKRAATTIRKSGIILFLGILILGTPSCGGEREGIVEYSDCRGKIILEPDTILKFYKTFTCQYTRRSSGQIVAGTCVHVVLSTGLFYSSGNCETAYIFSFTRGDQGCSKTHPHLGIDNMCYGDWRDADGAKREITSYDTEGKRVAVRQRSNRVIEVEIQGRGIVATFPEGTDPQVIRRAIKKHYFPNWTAYEKGETFDVASAKKEGYMDNEILSYLAQSRDAWREVENAWRSGLSDSDIIKTLASRPMASKITPGEGEHEEDPLGLRK